ncbi:tRNA acetyltransferase Tan1p [[Candida] railenensis]|uniref:tRNA acetyltransferase Tan1p n=1 Tax=[Candida] railenensis TaxID=45579 RepID=A0A9P0VZC5_9ASCO|nr:tRNA acetyltransferase Tan1p [[Candida] railenensis]
MGKRKGGSSGGGKSKKFKVGGFIDPYTSGVYATCTRGREQQCRKELMNLFSEKIEQYFDLENLENSEEDVEGESEELSIEDQIKKELGEMKESTVTKKELLTPIDLGCECLVFIKTRYPVKPETLIQKLVEESASSAQKTTRFTQRLTPISFSCSATNEELIKLAKRVLKPHFHKEEGQEPYKFAIQVSKRNFNAIPKLDIIKRIAECVGREHGHSVDLKKYDKLIMVECYKSNIGMSVVDKYEEYDKFNLQQIFDKTLGNDKDDNSSRVKNSRVNVATEEEEGEKEEFHTDKEIEGGEKTAEGDEQKSFEKEA